MEPVANNFSGIGLELPKLIYFTDRDKFEIPFKLSVANVSDWLGTVQRENKDYQACQQIYRFLKALQAERLPPQLRMEMLQSVAHALAGLSKAMELAVLEAKVPLPTPGHARQELLVALSALLAHGYAEVVAGLVADNHGKAARQDLAQALVAGLAALRKHLLFLCEGYQRPGRGFWRSCYQFYECAEAAGLLEFQLQPDAVSELAAIGSTFANNFKALLVFYLAGPYQCSAKMLRTFAFALDSCAALALLGGDLDSKKAAHCFAFDLRLDEEPVCAIRHDESDTAGLRYLDALAIAKLAYALMEGKPVVAGHLDKLKPVELSLVVKNLGLTAHRKLPRSHSGQKFQGIVGYDNIQHFFCTPRSSGQKESIEAMDPRKGEYRIPDFTLVPLDDGKTLGVDFGWKGVTDRRNEPERFGFDSWQQNPGDAHNKLSEFLVADSSPIGYGIIFHGQNPQVAIAELIGLFVDGQPGNMEIGIVRRINDAGYGDHHLGIELLGSQVEAVCIYKVGNMLTKCWALLLRGNAELHRPDGLIFNSAAFHVGDPLCIEQGKHSHYAQIGKLLHLVTGTNYAQLQNAP